MNIHAAVQILVGHRIEVGHLAYVQTRFLLYLTPHAFLNRLVHIHKTANEVERTLCWLLATTGYQHFVTWV